MGKMSSIDNYRSKLRQEREDELAKIRKQRGRRIRYVKILPPHMARKKDK
jgi:hypothetical protein